MNGEALSELTAHLSVERQTRVIKAVVTGFYRHKALVDSMRPKPEPLFPRAPAPRLPSEVRHG